MPKRKKDWQPDIYDLAARVPAAAVVEDDDDYDEESVADEVIPEPVAVAPAIAPAKNKIEYRVVVAAPQQQNGDLYTLGGMIAGAVVGALLGLFIAPRRGDETRQQLVKKAQDTVGQVTQKAQEDQ